LPSVPTALLSCQGGDKQDESAFSIYNKTPILHFAGMPKKWQKKIKPVKHHFYGHLAQPLEKVLHTVENTKHGNVKLVFYCCSYFAG
jgi:hypothetical protein